MKQSHIIVAGLIGLIVLSLQPRIAAAVIQFMFLGLIPGTTTSLPFWVLGIFYLGLAAAGLYWISVQPLYIGDHAHQDKVARSLARKRVKRETATSSPNSAPQRTKYGAKASETSA